MRVERTFFIHVMKTGGSSLRRVLWQGLAPGQVYPALADESLAEMRVANLDPRPLLGLTEAEHDPIRLYAAHLPFFVHEVMPRPLTMITVLREPVARTVSYLRHCQRYHPQHRDLSLEEIYEDPMTFAMFIRDHQAKVFSVRATDQGASVAAGLKIDEHRLASAIDHLRQVDLVGVHEGYEAFVARVAAQFGWDVPVLPRARVSTDASPISASLRRRIEDDNPADLAFYEAARVIAREQERAG